MPRGRAIAKNAMNPVSGASMGDISKNRAILSVIALISKRAITINPNTKLSRYNCLSERFDNLFIQVL